MQEVVAISSITVATDRQREMFPEQEMEELRQSILTEKGLMCPILVRPDPQEAGKYLLVAGERRLRAISKIDQPYICGQVTVQPGNIPVVIREFSSKMAAYEAELHENIIRLNLTWQEQAKAIKALHDLKVLQNPKHTEGMTAFLIDDSPTARDTGYAGGNTYKKVQAALLVSRMLDDKEVASAPTLKDATKVVSRKLEQEQLLKLQALRKQRQEDEADRAASAQVKMNGETSTDIIGDLTTGLSDDIIGGLELGAIGDAKLYEGDMLDLIAFVPDKSVHVVITDPPYGMGVADFGDSGISALKHEYSEENYEALNQALVKELPRICAASAHVYIFCDPDYFHTLRDAVSVLDGWRVRRTPLIWSKGQTGNLADGGAEGFKRSYEFILYARRGQRPGAFVTSDVLTYPMVRQKVHAAQKPVELYQRLLDMSAVPGDTIFDAFAGSGTIYHASRSRALKVIGIEKDPLFCEMCRLAIEGKTPNWKPEL